MPDPVASEPVLSPEDRAKAIAESFKSEAGVLDPEALPPRPPTRLERLEAERRAQKAGRVTRYEPVMQAVGDPRPEPTHPEPKVVAPPPPPFSPDIKGQRLDVVEFLNRTAVAWAGTMGNRDIGNISDPGQLFNPWLKAYGCYVAAVREAERRGERVTEFTE